MNKYRYIYFTLLLLISLTSSTSVFEDIGKTWSNNETTVWLRGNFDELADLLFFNNQSTKYVFGPADSFGQKDMYVTIGNYSEGNDLRPLLVTKKQQYDDTTLWSPSPIVKSIAGSIPATGGQLTVTGKFLNPITKATTAVFTVGSSASIPITNITALNGNECYINVAGEFCGANVSVNIRMRGVILPQLTFSYQAPTITQITSSNTTNVIIQGVGFCPSASLAKAYIDGVETSISSEQLSQTNAAIILPANLTSGDHVLAFNALGNLAPTNKTFSTKPILKSISSVSTNGGNVTLTGNFFCLTRSDGTKLTSKIMIDKVECTNGVNDDTDPNKIICKMPAGGGANKPVVVTIGTLTTSESVMFAYGLPEIQKYGMSGGLGYISGNSLGDLSLTKISYGLLEPFSPTKVESSNGVDKVYFALPKKARNAIVKLIVNSVNSNPIWWNLVPAVSNITSASTKGSTITINGDYLFLVDSNNTKLTSNITIGNSICKNAKELVMSTSLTCELPQGVGSALVSIVINNQSSNAVPFNFNLPNITSTYQVNNIGHIIGVDFAPSDKQYANQTLIFFGNFTSAQITDITVTDFNHITFRIPDNATLGANSINISVGGLSSQPNTSLTITPTIVGVTEVGVGGGDAIFSGYFLNFFKTVAASNASTSPAQQLLPYTIKVGSMVCSNITSISNTRFKCKLPSGVGRNHAVSITIQNLTMSTHDPVLYFNYSKPTAAAVSPITEKGGLITITGTDLNTPMNITLFNQLECQSPQVIPNTNYTQVTCLLPEWTDLDSLPESEVPMKLTVGNQDTEVQFKYDLEEYYADKRERERKARLKWLIPAIVVPTVVGIALIIGVAVILVKKNNENKELKKMFGK